MEISIGANSSGWSADEVALLGTAADVDVARKLGRSRQAVRHNRVRLGIPPVSHRPWTQKEVELVRKMPATEAAARTKRTVAAVLAKRSKVAGRAG